MRAEGVRLLAAVPFLRVGGLASLVAGRHVGPRVLRAEFQPVDGHREPLVALCLAHLQGPLRGVYRLHGFPGGCAWKDSNLRHPV